MITSPRRSSVMQAVGMGGLLLLAACSPAAPRPTATPSPAAPSATASATATPVPSPTASASATPSVSATAATPGYRDGSYEIAGKVVRLVGGVSEVEAAPGSASKIVTRVFGNEAQGDLNGDGVADVAFIITQTTGGSGTFFYAVVALRTPTGWTGTNGVLLGDRIAPQPTEVRGGAALFNYADRRAGEPMTAQPSVGVTKTLRVTNGRLAE